jgi:hypothetical protein
MVAPRLFRERHAQCGGLLFGEAFADHLRQTLEDNIRGGPIALPIAHVAFSSQLRRLVAIG